jgi:hypothetical protein
VDLPIMQSAEQIAAVEEQVSAAKAAMEAAVALVENWEPSQRTRHAIGEIRTAAVKVAWVEDSLKTLHQAALRNERA